MTGGQTFKTDLKKYFDDVFVFSRKDGYNISKKDLRSDIIKKSMSFDIFINHAYNIEFTDEGVNGYFYQTHLLNELMIQWKKSNKSGHIINSGSNCIFKSYGNGYNDPLYASTKQSLQSICDDAHVMYKKQEIKYKVSVINLPSLQNTGGNFTEIDFVDTIKFVTQANHYVHRIDFV
jgi:hypothetical protein